MSCHDQGTAEARQDGPLGSVTSGYLQVAPDEFTREELQALRAKARDLLPWTSMAKFDLLADLVDILDLLDALEARDGADLAAVETKTSCYYPRPKFWVHAPCCGPDCHAYNVGEA